MATDPRTIELLLDRISPAGQASARKMFGEYGIYCDDTFIGVVCSNRFHLKPTPSGLTYADDLELAPAYDGAKPSLVVPADRWDDEDWLVALIRLTVNSLSKPEKKKRKNSQAREK